MNLEVLNKLIKKFFESESFDGVDEIKVHDVILRAPFAPNLIFIDTEPIIKGIKYREIYPKVYEKIMEILNIMGENTREWDVRFNQRILENQEEFPFEQKIVNGKKIRTFNENVDNDELVWHRDREDRLVEVLEGENWMVQMDNQLPVKMKKGDSFIIPEGVYHRVLKGDGQLKISITVL